MPLRITIQPRDLWDERSGKFITLEKPVELSLEHSLVSISKWEAKWKKPFLSNEPKTEEEKLDYIKFMTLTQNVRDDVYYMLDTETVKRIDEYTNDAMTATTFSDNKQAQTTYRNEVITSEVIYYMMFANNIPVEFQKWHLNRLLALIKVCSIKNSPPKKMSKRETAASYAALNKARRAKHHTKG